MEILKKKTKLESGREKIKGVVSKIEQWSNDMGAGIKDLSDQKTSNDTEIEKLKGENSEIENEIKSANLVRESFLKLIGKENNTND